MEEKIKRRVDVNIAGITMSLVTDESDDFVNAVVDRMDDRMKALLQNVKRSQLDAAMLCAIAFCGDKITAEKRVRNLETQVSLYDVNMRRLKEEIADLKRRLGEEEAPAAKKVNVPLPDEQIRIDTSADTAESAPAPADNTRADKLKMIEALLKKDK